MIFENGVSAKLERHAFRDCFGIPWRQLPHGRVEGIDIRHRFEQAAQPALDRSHFRW